MKLFNFSYFMAFSCFCCLGGFTSLCTIRTMNITVDNEMSELYINGVRQNNLPNANNWMEADSVVLPCAPRVIAAKGTDFGVVAGILASTDDGFIMTNSSWKCTSVYYIGWQLVDYDDSFWPAAYSIAVHVTYPWKFVQGIRSDAYWIWTPGYEGGDSVVYCRKNIGPRPICPSRSLAITVDNEMRLYIDGVEKTGLTNADDWMKADTVALPWDTSVIAVQGTDDGFVAAGILASTDDGFIMTNSSWKCTSVYYIGWQLVDYDDSFWPAAHSIAVHVTYPWKFVQGIRRDAYWIWTPSYESRDSVVYCRKNIAVPTTQCDYTDE